MIKFDKLNKHDIPFVVKRITYCVILLLAIGLASIALGFTSRKSGQLGSERQHLQSLKAERADLEAEVVELTEQLAQMEIQAEAEVISKEDLVVTLGSCAEKADVVFTALSSRDVSTMDSITKYNFNFEIKGTAVQLAKLLEYLDDEQLHYAVNELSLRQNGDYLWLQRNFSEQITWWDISNIVISGGYPSQVGISSQDIMSDDIMSLYLDIDFIFVKASEEGTVSDIEETEHA